MNRFMIPLLGLLLAVGAMVAPPVLAQGRGTINPSSISWDEPQFDAVAIPPATTPAALIDLKEYRVEISNAGPAGPFTFKQFIVPAVNANPPAGSRVLIPRSAWPAPLLPLGQYDTRIVAIDLSGNVSAPSDVVPFELKDQTAPAAASNGRADP
jgi:hypothetical protein